MLVRPDDSRPLDAQEDEAWFDMESIGRRRYIVRRTVRALDYTILPVAGLCGLVWLIAPASRPLLSNSVAWVALAIGVVIVGSLVAAHAWDTWRSYERRSKISPLAEQTPERVE